MKDKFQGEKVNSESNSANVAVEISCNVLSLLINFNYSCAWRDAKMDCQSCDLQGNLCKLNGDAMKTIPKNGNLTEIKLEYTFVLFSMIMHTELQKN